MDASKLILVERLQEIIGTNYKDPASLSVQPTIVNTNELTQGQVEEVEDEDSDDEIQLMFTNDEGDEHEHDDASQEENEENDVDFESHWIHWVNYDVILFYVLFQRRYKNMI